MSYPEWEGYKDELIRIATHFYQKGWMVGTSGNLSVRVSDDTFLITASGRPKGMLLREDFLSVTGLESPPATTSDERKPSAEISIHQAIYSGVEDATAVFHIHSVESNIVSEWAVDHKVLLPPLEMIKGFGIADPSMGYKINVLENHLDVNQIAIELRELLFNTREPKESQLPAFLIRNHGLTVWGRDLMDAFHRIELLEYVFRFMVTSRAKDPSQISEGAH